MLLLWVHNFFYKGIHIYSINNYFKIKIMRTLQYTIYNTIFLKNDTLSDTGFDKDLTTMITGLFNCLKSTFFIEYIKNKTNI